MSENKPEEKKFEKKKQSKIEDLEIKKTCPECKEEKIFEGETAKQDASIWLADHLEKKHPEENEPPEKKYSEIEKKKAFALTCEQCGHQVASDDSKRTEELLATHLISHEQESKLKKKEESMFSGDLAIFAFGFALFFIAMSVIVGGIWHHRQKSLKDKTKGNGK